jgi:hypothetical protein
MRSAAAAGVTIFLPTAQYSYSMALKSIKKMILVFFHFEATARSLMAQCGIDFIDLNFQRE